MINKTLFVATLVPIIFSTSAVSAVEIYNDHTNSFAIGGHISAGIANLGHDTEVNSTSPRINIEAKRNLGEDFIVDAKVEWGLNFLDSDADADVFSQRLGYVGVAHKNYGRLIVGRQWSPYYDVAGIADLPVAFANDFLYDDQGNLGTARANKMVSYRNVLNFNRNLSLQLGGGWQGEHDTYDNRYQVAATLQFTQFNLGYAFTAGDVTNDNAMSNVFSAGYGHYGKGFYAAGVLALNENMNGAKDTTASDLIAAYGLNSGVNLIWNMEVVDDKDNAVGYSNMAFQVEYQIVPKVLGYAGYLVDMESDANDKENQWMFGARLYL